MFVLKELVRFVCRVSDRRFLNFSMLHVEFEDFNRGFLNFSMEHVEVLWFMVYGLTVS